jgi:hypothetical protein
LRPKARCPKRCVFVSVAPRIAGRCTRRWNSWLTPLSNRRRAPRLSSEASHSVRKDLRRCGHFPRGDSCLCRPDSAMGPGVHVGFRASLHYGSQYAVQIEIVLSCARVHAGRIGSSLKGHSYKACRKAVLIRKAAPNSSGKTPQLHVFLLLCAFARVPADAFFNLIRL